MMIVGKLVSGRRKGKIFLGQEGYIKRIEEKLGFHPYPGTLNLKLEPEPKGPGVPENPKDLKGPKIPSTGIRTRNDLEGNDSIRIKGFEDDGRFFGGLRCYPCKVSSLKSKDGGSKNAGVDGVVIVPDKTRNPPDVIEIISPVSLRDSLSLKDGDSVSIDLTWK